MKETLAQETTNAPTCEICGTQVSRSIYSADAGPYDCCETCGHHAQRGIQISEAQMCFEEEQCKFYGEETVCMGSMFGYLQSDRTERRIRAIGKYLDKGRILEVGPGGGSLLARLARLGYEVEAMEHSPSLAKFIQSEYGISVNVGSFEQFDVGASTFDAFLSFHVIEHVPDAQEHLRKAGSIVRDRGFGFFATPNANGWEHRLFGGLSPNYSSAHVRIFSARSFELLLEKTGWKVVECMTPSYSSDWLRVGSSIRRRLIQTDRKENRGQFARGENTFIRRALLQAFGAISYPVRRLQETFLAGNELLFVVQRKDSGQ